MLKKILKRTFLVLGILIVLLILAPFLFKKQILQAVKKEINQNINGTIDFADVNISFFRDFPKVSLALEDVKLVGKGEFSSDTLLQAQKIDAAVNFMSVIKGTDFKIYSVEINELRINAIVHKNGKANWDL